MAVNKVNMKVEVEMESCCVCGGGGELLSPEEHDASAPPMQVPLRTMLIHLNTNKEVPEGKMCSSCIRRTMESYEFSTVLSTRGGPPLSEKIRALRRSSSHIETIRRRRVTLPQLELLWKLLNSQRDVALGLNKSAQAREHSKRMWETVAKSLNTHRFGAIKTWKDWSTYWVDYKSKLKKRLVVLKHAQNNPGSGPVAVPPLQEIERKFLTLLGEDYSGLPNCENDPLTSSLSTTTTNMDVSQSGINFEYVDQASTSDSAIRAEDAQVLLLLQDGVPSQPQAPQQQSERQGVQRPATGSAPILPNSRRTNLPRRRRRIAMPLLTKETARTSLLEISRKKLALEEKKCETLQQMLNVMNRIAGKLDRLHELTQKIDVFIVVGGAGAGGAYSEEDIIMVERDTLAHAAAADDDELERARNARGDSVYQCSVCPLSFQRVAEYRAHSATHPTDALHCCWTCGAQFSSRAALRSHCGAACGAALCCALCGRAQATQHECAPRCPACDVLLPDRGALAQHCAATHGRTARAPHVCPHCFRTCDTSELLSAHLLRHRQAKQFVCGYDGCILRFGTRTNLMAHIRKCHTLEPPSPPPEPAPAPTPAPASTTCDTCGRTFGSVAAMKRHARVHRTSRTYQQLAQEEGNESQEGEDMEGEVEYLEVEELDELQYRQ